MKQYKNEQNISGEMHQCTVLRWVIKSTSHNYYLVCIILPPLIIFHIKDRKMMSVGSKDVLEEVLRNHFPCSSLIYFYCDERGKLENIRIDERGKLI